MWSACHKKSYWTNLEVRNLKSEISCLCPVWLSQFCLFWKKVGKGFVNIPKFVNWTHNKYLFLWHADHIRDRSSFIVQGQKDHGTSSKSYQGSGQAGTACQNPGYVIRFWQSVLSRGTKGDRPEKYFLKQEKDGLKQKKDVLKQKRTFRTWKDVLKQEMKF